LIAPLISKEGHSVCSVLYVMVNTIYRMRVIDVLLGYCYSELLSFRFDKKIYFICVVAES
jgi:hypothetical protein